jgi:CubicO group peptidase (beta-lactamase class C family)
LASCNKTDDTTDSSGTENQAELYFPPLSGTNWEIESPEELGWDTSKVNELNSFLENSGTRAFIVLKDGKIVFENYWGVQIVGSAPFTKESQWYWASAGKTLMAFMMGTAQEAGLLDIENPTSDYLGDGWTSLQQEDENNINLEHHLTMTTGLDYGVDNPDCITASCLQYKAAPGTQWYYHNAPYTLLGHVLATVSGLSLSQYTQDSVGDAIGINGSWRSTGDHDVFWSTAREAARFGLLLQAQGLWNGKAVLKDTDFMEALSKPSQNLNPSYGYLTWLNGQSTIALPNSALTFPGPLSPNAPDDLFAAMGKNGQYIDVVPSKGLVVVRMGTTPDENWVPTEFHDDIWEKLSAIIK